MNNQSSNFGLVLLIGVISVTALILAWVAYNRSGENLTMELQQGAQEVAEETEQETRELGSAVEETVDRTMTSAEATLARAEARAELLAIEAEFEAEENYEDALEEVRSVRADLRIAYQNAEGEIREQWREVDQELESLGQSLRAESADALETLAGLILLLEADVRTDEE